MPARVLSEAEHFEPAMMGMPVGAAPATVIGFDIVRGSDGELVVLEDNLRTPSGLAYAAAARRACDDWLDDAVDSDRRDLDVAYEWLGDALRAAAPDGNGDPSLVLLSDGPANSAWYEHSELARRIGIPLVVPGQLRTRGGRLVADLNGGRAREIDVIYRRTDEDRLRDRFRRPTWIAEALLGPMSSGRLTVLNSFGSGVADDKLSHAYVEEMIRFYLGQEPKVRSIPTHDLGAEPALSGVRSRLDELVVKPRSAYGGIGVVIGTKADRGELRRLRRLLAKSPESFIAQELVALSRAPTVCRGRLEPRHVDLRAFAISDQGSGGRTRIVPGGLTRVALGRGSLIVNSSKGGGGKDTWVLAR